MKSRLLLVLALLLLPAVALAAGPRDGSYYVQETQQTQPYASGSIAYFVVLQNGDQIGFALLQAEGGPWRYGAGVLSENHATGELRLPDGASYGTFDLTITEAGQLSGTLYEFGGAYLYVQGSRFF